MFTLMYQLIFAKSKERGAWRLIADTSDQLGELRVGQDHRIYRRIVGCQVVWSQPQIDAPSIRTHCSIFIARVQKYSLLMVQLVAGDHEREKLEKVSSL